MGKAKISEELHQATWEIIRLGLMEFPKSRIKKMCAQNLLPVSGNKTVLTRRLMEHWNTCKLDVSVPESSGNSVQCLVTAWYEPR